MVDDDRRKQLERAQEAFNNWPDYMRENVIRTDRSSQESQTRSDRNGNRQGAPRSPDRGAGASRR